MTSTDNTTHCPCGHLDSYANCCQPLHAGQTATTAAQLMRSRYTAYVLKREDYLLASWHPSTRPTTLALHAQQPSPTWQWLDIPHHESPDGDHASVEFVARYRLAGGRAQRQHEVSRFVREDGRWYYVDGELKS
jgi:SEC-C motif-containing protein